MIDVILYSLLSGVLPALLWLWFWIKEDNLHPEPKKTIFSAFIAGGLSVVIALQIEKYISDIGFTTLSSYALWAAAEEIVKLIAVFIVAIGSKQIDEPIDIMIYCITVALGFSAIENALFIFSPIYQGNIANSIITGNLRFIGASLVHIVSSATIGFMIGLAFYRNIYWKIISATIGVILGIALHATFNLSIINTTGTDTLRVFGWVWGAIVIILILFEEIKIIKPKIE